jgi:hypothetical protein
LGQNLDHLLEFRVLELASLQVGVHLGEEFFVVFRGFVIFIIIRVGGGVIGVGGVIRVG